MSATNRSKVRRSGDWYPTPKFCVDRLLDEVPLPHGHWLEPAAGTGALIRAVNQYAYLTDPFDTASLPSITWDACEMSFWAYQELKPLCQNLFIGNFLKTDFEVGKYKVIITNPPYSLAMEFIDKALSLKPEKLVLLLRTNFLESEKRVQFMRSNTPDVYVLPSRPSFTGKGNDATSYAWFVWSKTPQTQGIIQVLESTPLAQRKK